MDNLSILCFGYLPWSERWKRNQSMFAGLARSAIVKEALFVNPPVWKRFGNGPLWSMPDTTANSEGVHVYTPRIIMPGKRFTRMAWRIDTLVWRLQLGSKGRFLNPDIVLVNNPLFPCWEFLEGVVRNSRLCVADLSDDFVELYRPRATRDLVGERMRSMVEFADLVLCVNDYVKEKYARHHDRCVVIRNATNILRFNKSDLDDSYHAMMAIREQHDRVLACTGTLNLARIDVELLGQVVDAISEAAFVFIGDADSDLLMALGSKPNVYFFSPVPIGRLRQLLEIVDAGIIPFKINEHTKGNDLLKIYDFMVLGKPVVTTPLPTVLEDPRLMNLVSVARDSHEFISACRELEKFRLDSELAQSRVRYGYDNRWEVRVQEVWAWIDRTWGGLPHEYGKMSTCI